LAAASAAASAHAAVLHWATAGSADGAALIALHSVVLSAAPLYLVTIAIAKGGAHLQFGQLKSGSPTGTYSCAAQPLHDIVAASVPSSSSLVPGGGVATLVHDRSCAATSSYAAVKPHLLLQSYWSSPSSSDEVRTIASIWYQCTTEADLM
jgi:hypothetical protein